MEHEKYGAEDLSCVQHSQTVRVGQGRMMEQIQAAVGQRWESFWISGGAASPTKENS